MSGSSDTNYTRRGATAETCTNKIIKCSGFQSVEIDGFKSEYIHNDYQINTDGTHFITARGNSVNYTESDFFHCVNGSYNLSINDSTHIVRNSNYFETIIGSIARNITGDQHETQAGSRYLKIDGDLSIVITGKLRLMADLVQVRAFGGIDLDGEPTHINSGRAPYVSICDANTAQPVAVDYKSAIKVAGSGHQNCDADTLVTKDNNTMFIPRLGVDKDGKPLPAVYLPKEADVGIAKNTVRA